MEATQLAKADSPPACVEGGTWTAVPRDPPATPEEYTLPLAAVDPAENTTITQAGVMILHLVGYTGDFSDQQYESGVAMAMAAQVTAPGSAGLPGGPARQASFLYHLGGIVYTDDDKSDPSGKNQSQMYARQFYQPFTGYGRSIFAIAGNHDGKCSGKDLTSAIDHFLLNFCATTSGISPDNTVDKRLAMVQPYVYWRLETPFASIIGLYANVANSGVLDNPGGATQPQYDWLVQQLGDVREQSARSTQRTALLLAVHYPPYSGAVNFLQRGDPTLVRSETVENGEAPEVTRLAPSASAPQGTSGARPLAMWLEQAFQDSNAYPDAVFSAHAHLYQRLTSTYGDGRQVPYLIVGSGGHVPVEDIWEQCNKESSTQQTLPFPAVLPPGLSLLPGQSVEVQAYADRSTGGQFGFLRLTVAPGQPNVLVGEFFTAYPGSPTLADSLHAGHGRAQGGAIRQEVICWVAGVSLSPRPCHGLHFRLSSAASGKGASSHANERAGHRQ